LSDENALYDAMVEHCEIYGYNIDGAVVAGFARCIAEKFGARAPAATVAEPSEQARMNELTRASAAGQAEGIRLGIAMQKDAQAAQQQAEPGKFFVSQEWLTKRLEKADDADCAAGQSQPKRPCDAPPGCDATNCLGCGEQQAEPVGDGIHTMYVWHAREKGDETDRFIRAWTSDAENVAALQATIGEPPIVYRAAQSDQRAGVAEGAIGVPVVRLKEWLAAFHEELAAYDIDPPIYHLAESAKQIQEILDANPIQKGAGDA